MAITARVDFDHKYEAPLAELISALNMVNVSTNDEIRFELDDGTPIEFSRFELEWDGTDGDANAKRLVVCRLGARQKGKTRKAAR